MGFPAVYADEVPVHTVEVASFYMSKYEVTQEEWQKVMENNPSYFKGPNLPVENVSWYDAVAYCDKRSEQECLSPVYTISGTGVETSVEADWTAVGYRLPTESEWEYEARGGNKSSGYSYAGGDNERPKWAGIGKTAVTRYWTGSGTRKKRIMDEPTRWGERPRMNWGSTT